MSRNKPHLILDIDDVIRNIKDKIISSLNIYYQTTEWGEYTYHNPKIRDFFTWYRSQDFYHHIFKNCEFNIEMGLMIDSLIRHGYKVSLLSSNDNEKGRSITEAFLKKHLLYYDSITTHFVDKACEKISFILNSNYDKDNIIFVDDRGDTCLDFHRENIKVFWYTKYTKISDWLNMFPGLSDIPRGDTIDLIDFINFKKEFENGKTNSIRRKGKKQNPERSGHTCRCCKDNTRTKRS